MVDHKGLNLKLNVLQHIWWKWSEAAARGSRFDLGTRAGYDRGQLQGTAPSDDQLEAQMAPVIRLEDAQDGFSMGELHLNLQANRLVRLMVPSRNSDSHVDRFW